MINLLPPTEKEVIEKEKTLRVALVLAITFLAALICFSLVLSLIKTVVAGEAEAEKILSEHKEKELEDLSVKSKEKEISELNKEIISLNNFYEGQVSFVGIVERITGLLPAGVSLNNISLSSNIDKEVVAACALSGFSNNRETLLELKANLENEASFKNVSFPSSIWTKQTDISFTVNFSISKLVF